MYYLTRANHDCTSVQSIFNWNTSITGHKQGTVGFPLRKLLLSATIIYTIAIYSFGIQNACNLFPLYHESYWRD